ncbi:MAG: MG2 domain-containing protein [Pirellulales bacterium]|nr:MG2 domain-containing protein [Pirellulales bacterium]
MRSLILGYGLGALLVMLGTTWTLLAEKPPANDSDPRAVAKRLFGEGNYNEAFGKYKGLLLDPQQTGAPAGEDLQMAVSCLQQLARDNELDELREQAIKLRPQDWRFLQMAARTYAQGNHFGFTIAGKFERGHHRGGGEWTSSANRDYVRALQLLQQALPHVAAEADAPSRSQFYWDLAQTLQQHPLHGQYWHFQMLSDLSTLPDYESQNFYGGNTAGGAAVDAEGNPLFYASPKTWEAAANDGERWRWALTMAVESDPAALNRARWAMAQFCQTLYGEQTLAQFDFYAPRAAVEAWDDGSEDIRKRQDVADGPFAVHTLKETETLAKLATGVKRFELPDEFNYIKIFRQIIENKAGGMADQAYDALAGVFENRRQFPAAAEVWQAAIKDIGAGHDNYRQKRLDQIIKNWGRFENNLTQPAGEAATIDFTFRNAKKVAFTAKAIKIDQLLTDVRAYLRTRPNQVDWQQINVGDIGYQLVNANFAKYVGEQVAQWDLELKPADNHWDSRITVETPLKKAGAYLLTAKLADGNETRIIIWLQDTVIIKKQLEGRNLYLVLDAVTGKPIPKANVEFLGFQQQHTGNNQFTFNLRNFAEFSDADGQLMLGAGKMPQDFQWLIMARTDAGRLAYLGFTNVWYGARHDEQYDQTKVFTITDRPVYRPAQKVNFKFWIGHAKYDLPDDHSPFANQNLMVEIHNPKGEKVLEKPIASDEYGGVLGEYELPADAPLGMYQIFLVGHGGGSFRVEEYKKPEFEVTVAAPTEPVRLGEKITATVQAKYYFGAPVAKGKIKYKVLRSPFTDRWYPPGPWDWLFGRGYWWFAYDYDWYPGWHRWGCMRPVQIWWFRPSAPPEVVLDATAELPADGVFKIEIDTALAKELHSDQDHRYSITAEVVDESRRVIVGAGEVIVARKPFEVTTWLTRGYYRTGDTIDAHFMAQTLSNKPVQGKGELALYRISYDKDGKPTEERAELWNLNTGEDGSARQQIKAGAPGQYRLSFRVTDSANHTVEGAYIFTIVGPQFDSAKYRFEHLELIPDLQEYHPGDTVKLQVNTDQADSTVYLFVRPTNGVYLPPQVLRIQGKSTIVEIPVTLKDMPNFFVEALTVSGAQVHTEVREIVLPPEKRILNVALTPSAEVYKPGQKATVKIRLTDHTGEAFVGSTVVSIYDKAVEYISGGSNVPEIKEFFWKWRRHHHPQTEHSLQQISYAIGKTNEILMAQIGAFGNITQEAFLNTRKAGMAGRMRGGRPGLAKAAFALRDGNALAAPMAAAPGAEGASEAFGAAAPMDALKSEATSLAAADTGGGVGPAPGPNVTPTIRSNFADTALWVGALTTAKDGTAEVELTMPENLTGWKVRAWSLGVGTRVGQGETIVTTNKDVIVRLQAPRFFVDTDEVVLSANVHNYLKTAKQVTVKLDLPGNLLKLVEKPLASNTTPTLETVIEIPAGGEQRVDWRVKVTGEGEAVVRMSALTDEDSDAMEQKFPVYIHGMLKMDSFSGMLRPQDEKGLVTFKVPAERRPEQSRLEVRFSPTLAGACVDALPFMVDYPYGCTEQTLNRFLPTVITQRILQRMGLDLKAIQQKRTNLNAQEIGDPMKRAAQWQRFERNPVFDEEEVRSMVRDGVQRLTEMQLSDGGWGWFSGFGEHSWPHTTAVVVHGLQIAQANEVALVPGMLEKGVEWLKNYQTEQVQWLKNGDEVRKNKGNPNNLRWKDQADNLDALVYMVLADADVKDQAMCDYLYRDRTNLAVYAKALFGLALHKQAEKEKLAMILQNISQFVVVDDENQTAYLKLPQDNWWWNWYGSEIEAHAFYLKLLSATDPKGELAPKLVKYLLNNRKHATYWNSTRDTAYAIEALADFMKASGEDQPDMIVEVWLDGKQYKQVKITAQDLFTVDNTLVLTGDAVTTGEHKLELRKSGTGPLYYNAYVSNFTLEDFITRAGLEVKVNRKFYRLEPEDKQVAVSGSRGQAIKQKVEKYKRIELENLSEVKSGDLLEVELEIDSKNDYEYLLFEDLKAAGTETVEVRSGYNGNAMGAYVEFRDSRVCFFIRTLARGKHSVAYRLRAEIPGQFSALPARASAMYAPELRGNSDEMKLRIVD